MIERAQIVACCVASLRLEGLRASTQVEGLLAAWARGEASDEDLVAAERHILAGGQLAGRLAPATPRAA